MSAIESIHPMGITPHPAEKTVETGNKNPLVVTDSYGKQVNPPSFSLTYLVTGDIIPYTGN